MTITDILNKLREEGIEVDKTLTREEYRNIQLSNLHLWDEIQVLMELKLGWRSALRKSVQRYNLSN